MQNVHTEDSKISFIPMFYLLDEVATYLIFRILSNTPASRFGFESQMDQISPEIKPLQ